MIQNWLMAEQSHTLRPLPLRHGVALRGIVWPGGPAPAVEGILLVAPDGRVDRMGPADQVSVPQDVPVIGGPGHWIGPGVVDAHVHLAFGGPDLAPRQGVIGVRDLGAPRRDALRWRTGGRAAVGRPAVSVAGEIITAPGGYPSRSWGADGFAQFAADPEQARRLVGERVRDGVDLVKLALEPGQGWPVPSVEVARAVVRASHDAGLPVVAHALRVEMVDRAVTAGVDELAHTPTDPLPAALVDRIAAAGMGVASTLQTFVTSGQGAATMANAAALHAAGVTLRYGTDLGNAGTQPGVDPRELACLAEVGLGRRGALVAATEVAAAAPGMRGRTGTLAEGSPAALVVLRADPLTEPDAWTRPVAVLCDGWLIGG